MCIVSGWLETAYNYLMNQIGDQQLRAYIDQVFMVFDRDRSGTLDPMELGNFFNEVFSRIGWPMRVNQMQAMQAMRAIDRNGDGKANKMELFMAIKQMSNQQGMYGGQGNMYGSGQGMYGQGSMYGQGGYGGYGGQGPWNQGGYGNQSYGGQPSYGQGGMFGQPMNNTYGGMNYGQGGYGQGGMYGTGFRQQGMGGFGQPPMDGYGMGGMGGYPPNNGW